MILVPLAAAAHAARLQSNCFSRARPRCIIGDIQDFDTGHVLKRKARASHDMNLPRKVQSRHANLGLQSRPRSGGQGRMFISDLRHDKTVSTPELAN